jgi:hypothetical protein
MLDMLRNHLSNTHSIRVEVRGRGPAAAHGRSAAPGWRAAACRTRPCCRLPRATQDARAASRRAVHIACVCRTFALDKHVRVAPPCGPQVIIIVLISVELIVGILECLGMLGIFEGHE